MIETIVVIVIGVVILGNIGMRMQRKKLKEAYEAALRGSNKKVALDAGRAYYSSLRGGKWLTIYDEQAITNDLSAMK